MHGSNRAIPRWRWWCCRRQPTNTTGGGDVAEDLSEHLEHVELSRVLGLAPPVLLLQTLLLHLVEVLLGLGALLQEALHQLVQGEAGHALAAPPAQSRRGRGGGCGGEHSRRRRSAVDGWLHWDTCRSTHGHVLRDLATSKWTIKHSTRHSELYNTQPESNSSHVFVHLKKKLTWILPTHICLHSFLLQGETHNHCFRELPN